MYIVALTVSSLKLRPCSSCQFSVLEALRRMQKALTALYFLTSATKQAVADD